MGFSLILTIAMTLPLGGGHGKSSTACSSCESCNTCQTCKTCQTCNPCGCQSCDDCSSGHCCTVWCALGLPHPCHPPGNMHQHLPYYAEPKMYYYFRPYNYRHIPMQQGEALSFGASPGLPYSNAMFQQVYAELPPEKPVEFVPYDSDEPAAPTPPAELPAP